MNMAFPAGISQILGLDAPSILRESGKNHTNPFWFTLHDGLDHLLDGYLHLCLMSNSTILLPNLGMKHRMVLNQWNKRFGSNLKSKKNWLVSKKD